MNYYHNLSIDRPLRGFKVLIGIITGMFLVSLMNPSQTVAQYIPHKELNFDDQSISGWQSPIGSEHCCSDSIKVVGSPVRAGSHAVRFIVRDGDIPANSNGGERAELRLNGSNNQDKIPYFTDAWHGFSVYIDPSYQPNDSYRFNILAQWHPNISGENPVLDLEYSRGGLFYIYIRSTPKPDPLMYNIGTPEKGRWHDFIFNTRFDYRETSSGGNGYVKVWLNGSQVLDYKGPVGYTNATGPYFKMGIYRNPDIYSATQIVYHDEFRRGTSYAEVDPSRGGGGAAPTPVPTINPTATPIPSQQPCPGKSQGDANCDGKINGVDYSIWLNSQCRKTTTQSCASTVADFNSDGNVDDADYQIWFGNRG